MQAFESVSTWRQPRPPPLSRERAAVISTVAGWLAQRGPGRLRVAVDGLTGAGKTSFGHELAAELRYLGRPTMRASMDDFKHPWRHAREHGYDRVSGEGYYRNAYDFVSARELLLGPAGPAGPDGCGEVVLCGHDPLTGQDHRDQRISAPAGAEVGPQHMADVIVDINDLASPRILSHRHAQSWLPDMTAGPP